MDKIPSAWQRREQRYHLLLIEDDSDFSDLLGRLLASHGFEVTTASDSLQGLRHFRQHSPDAVIANIVLPGTDGITFIRDVKAQAPEVPTIAMAGLDQQSNQGFISLALLQGADAVLCKPFNINQLLNTLGDLLQARFRPMHADHRILD